MQFKKRAIASVLWLGMVGSVGAANVSIQGTLPGIVQIESLHAFSPIIKPISYQHIVLSKDAKQMLASRLIQKNAASLTLADQRLPNDASLGMNGAPVLDQGYHGTCVTFAVTGAMNAAVGEAQVTQSDDHYSQLCSLELGSTLENDSPVDDNGYHTYPSGWDGSWATIVLDQVNKYGLITKQLQTTKGCAGVYEYPLMVENDHGRAMPIADYNAQSEKKETLPGYKIILAPDDAFSSKTNMASVLTQVKTAIAAGHRVLFGTLLDVDRGGNGALGKYKVAGDTWLLTSEISDDAKAGIIEAGHEMIITGYDDKAAAIGPEGEKHRGVLTLRNSWSAEAGDHGNYYMTYDHFKSLTLEAAEVLPV